MLRPNIRPKISKLKQIPKPRVPSKFNLIPPILHMLTSPSLQLILQQMPIKMRIKISKHLRNLYKMPIEMFKLWNKQEIENIFSIMYKLFILIFRIIVLDSCFSLSIDC